MKNLPTQKKFDIKRLQNKKERYLREIDEIEKNMLWIRYFDDETNNNNHSNCKIDFCKSDMGQQKKFLRKKAKLKKKTISKNDYPSTSNNN